jgi:hypothetical protein
MSDTRAATTPAPPTRKGKRATEPPDRRAVADLVAAAKAAYAYLSVYARLPKERYLPGEAAAGLALKDALARVEGHPPDEFGPGDDFGRLLAEAWAGLAREGRTPERWADEGIDHSDDPPGYDATRPWRSGGRSDGEP